MDGGLSGLGLNTRKLEEVILILMFDFFTSYPQARVAGVRENKWVLLNVQSRIDFDCHKVCLPKKWICSAYIDMETHKIQGKLCIGNENELSQLPLPL